PAVTRRAGADGAGDAWYLATMLGRDDLRSLVGRALEGAGVAAVPGASAEVEVTRRSADGRAYLFVVNHGADDADVAVRGTELVTGSVVDGRLVVPGGTVRVIREEGAA
ncbi:Beta-galactosidase C-terminal domain, partial [Agromyces binzhouensis]